MRAWESPAVPRLPGSGVVPRVHDTASGRLQESAGHDAARLYVCGITPYDATHLGHAATYLTFDILQRCWRDAGLRTTYVQNVTDVDDPLLERARGLGVEWTDVAADQIELFRTDMAALSVLPPDAYVGVVESIELVTDLIARLDRAGAVYRVEDDLYFAVHTVPGGSGPEFGFESHLNPEQMLATFSERGGDPDRAGKKHPLDYLLWRAERPNEPAWDSPLGRGRPGWHVECTAIALHHLGPAFDVQGGGSDLIFPHHEMCAVQGSVATAEPFANSFVHQAMVRLHGAKMSKSQGNLVFVSKLRGSGVDPAAIRLAVLDHHYRGEWDWTDAGLAVAVERLASWRDAGEVRLPVEGPLSVIREALADDLDTPRALRLLDGATTGAWAEDGAESASLADVADALLGVKL